VLGNRWAWSFFATPLWDYADRKDREGKVPEAPSLTTTPSLCTPYMVMQALHAIRPAL